MYQRIIEDIRPSADLRYHYSEISKECRENRTAIILTVDGRADTVALGYQQYQTMKARLELLEMLEEAEQDHSNNRVSSMDDVFIRARNKLLNAEIL